MFPSNNDGDEDGESGKGRAEQQANDSRIHVKFTKNAVELLRETITVFLRKVGRELLEKIEEGDPLSQQQHPIRPEDVVSVLLAFGDDRDESNSNELTDAAADEDKDNCERIRTSGTPQSKSDNRLPEMKEFVRQAQDLLLQRKYLERQESERLKKRKEVGIGSTAQKTNNTVVTKATLQQQPKKRKGKRKKQKITITADMEAEQERLLNASKIALESSQQKKGGNNATSFRVELS